jgi:hypothetical protein
VAGETGNKIHGAEGLVKCVQNGVGNYGDTVIYVWLTLQAHARQEFNREKITTNLVIDISRLLQLTDKPGVLRKIV